MIAQNRLVQKLRGLSQIVGLFSIALLLAASFRVRAADHPLVVAYIDGDTLYTWQEGTTTPRTIATGKLAHPLLSPDSDQLLFQRDNDLWIADLTKSTIAPKTLVSSGMISIAPDKSRFVLNSVWLDSKTVIFNTYHYHPTELVQQQFADDLWQVDTTSGKVTRLLADGDGGDFSISPDAKHIAVIRPGDYATSTLGAITVVDSSGKNAVKLLEFPVVNTGASYQFYPQPVWNEASSSLFIAIPDPNLIYATDKVPATALWKLGLDGTKTQIGSVQADFFGLPQFSSDGKYILYAQRIGAVKDNQIGLLAAHGDGTSEQKIVSDMIGTLEPAHWVSTTTSYTFVHGKPGQLWISDTVSNRLLRIPNDSTLVFNVIWADATTYVYETSPGGAGEVQYVGSDSAIHTVAECKACGEINARR